MDSLNELIQQRIDRIESVPSELQTKIDAQNDVLFKVILKELNTLDTEGGKIVTSIDNLAKVGAIIEKLKQTLFSGEYVQAIQAFAAEINNQATLNNNILDKVVGGFTNTAIYSATVKAAQHNALLLLDENAISANLLEPLTQILTNSIINNSSFTDAVEALRQNMTGAASLLSKYAGAYVKDAFAASDRQYVQLTAREHGIEFYRYDGGHVSDTREFCLERINGIFHHDEIAKWGDNNNTRPGEFSFPAVSPVYTTKNGIKLYWQGENYDTNSATIFSYCGGYNCEHILVPIATQYVPKLDIERAKSLGFYSV